MKLRIQKIILMAISVMFLIFSLILMAQFEISSFLAGVICCLASIRTAKAIFG